MNLNTPIPTGLPAIDQMLGGGGLPRRHITELYGLPDSGKTTCALNWIAAAQRSGLTTVFVDAERKIDAAWAADTGVDLSELVLVQPDNGNQALSMAETLLRTFSVDLLVVDSIAALGAEDETIAASEDLPLDAHTEFVARSLRRMRSIAERSGTALLVLNQMRSRMRAGEPESSCAGRALGLHAAIRIRLRRDYGRLLFTTIKNKLADPFADAEALLSGARLESWERQQPQRELRPPAYRVAKTG